MRYLLLCLLAFTSLTLAAQIDGKWYGILDAMGTKLPLALDVANNGTAGSMSSPSQTQAKFPFSAATFDGKLLKVTVGDLGAEFSGALDGKELRGIFTQAGVDFPLTFTRHVPDGFPIGDEPITIVQRLQDPKDFPYEREAVSFAGGAEGVTLAGELTRPSAGKPKAVVVLISGSGPQDRNSYLGSQINHSPFLVLSDYLTRRGYAVLRYDERGVGESTGEFGVATTYDLAEDARAAVRYLRQRKDYKRAMIGLIGHSEGGVIAPMVAGEEELDFTVLLAAPAVPGDSLQMVQRRAFARSMNIPMAMVEREEPGLRRAFAFIKESPGLDQDQYVEALYALFEREMVNLPEPLRRSITDPRKFNAQYVVPLSSPWMRAWIGLDPKPYLLQLTMPTLALNGTLDTQVPAALNLNAISAAMATNGNKKYERALLPGLNHLFQPAETGAPSEYGTIPTTFSPVALDKIGTWLDKHFD